MGKEGISKDKLREALLEEMQEPVKDKTEMLHLVKEFYSEPNGLDFYEKLLLNEDNIYLNERELSELAKSSNEVLLNLYNMWKDRAGKYPVKGVLGKEVQDGYSKREQEGIRRLPSYTTGEEVKALLDRKDKELSDILPMMSQDESFYHVAGFRMLGYKNKKEDGDVRLYLSPSEKYTAKIVEEFAKKALDQKIPFYLKFLHNDDRADQIVIVSSYKDFEMYRKLIREVKSEHPELFQEYKIGNPLWGKVDGMIGIGENTYGPGKSYSSTRTKMVAESIEATTDILIRKALDEKKIVNIQGRKVPFKDLLDRFITEPISNDTTHYKLSTSSGKLVELLYNSIYRVDSFQIFKSKMKEHCKKYGIDPENIVFNKVYREPNLLEHDKKEGKKNEMRNRMLARFLRPKRAKANIKRSMDNNM